MKIVGLLDSPFVRRTVITARMLGIPFEHQSLSVFRNFDEFHAINPLAKAPTLVLDDGEVLVDSTHIIDWFERTAPAGRSLLPGDPAQLLRCLQLTGFGLAGHLLLTVFTVAAFYLASPSVIGILGSATSFLMTVIFTAFEALIQALQAYIFTLLTAVYIAGSLHAEH